MAYNSLEIGKRALLAQRMALDVTSNNIANVNTPGYSRRTPVFVETDPLFQKGNFYGTGVVVNTLRTFREDFFDREVRNSITRRATYEVDLKHVERLETIFAEPSDLGLGNTVNEFFNSFKEIALNPENIGLREVVLSKAQTLVDRVSTTALQMAETREESAKTVKLNVQQANRLINEVAGLNGGFSGGQRLSADDAQTLIDKREEALEQLAKLVDIKVTSNEDGTNNVFINGISVVTATIPSTLEVRDVISDLGEQSLRIVKTDRDGNIVNTINPASGEMAANIKNFNVTLDPNDSSNGFSVAKKLEEMTTAIVENVNNVFAQGYGMDDTGDTPPGRVLFVPASGTNINSFNIRLNQEIVSNVRNMPIADSEGEFGNGEIARKAANLQNDPNFVDGTTVGEYYAGFMGKLASIASEAKSGLQVSRLVSEQLINQRESVIGVNLDEEAINIVKFQQAFQAASRVIQTTNEILQTIVNLGR